MHSQIIKDQTGTPISVLIDYQDWLEIEQQLKLKKDNSDLEEPDMYTLTETSRAILNELIVYTGREELKELKNEHPDQKRIAELRSLLGEVLKINRETENFKSPARMQEIIDKYAPKVRDIYNAA
jgi:hypothetical protein